MLDPQEDKSDLGENQDLEIGSDELTAVKAQLSASSSESKLLNEVNKVILSPDFNYFSELSEKDERMADKVIEKIAKLKGMDEEEVRKLLIPVNESKEIDVNAEVRKAIAKEKGEQTLQDFIKETGLDKDKDLSEEFLSNFYDYME
jgi:Tat protein secretion system quality control protein TatD with DNase activity